MKRPGGFGWNFQNVPVGIFRDREESVKKYGSIFADCISAGRCKLQRNPGRETAARKISCVVCGKLRFALGLEVNQ